MRGSYRRLALGIAHEALRHDGVRCVLVVRTPRAPSHLPPRSDVPNAIGMRFTKLGSLGPCIVYMFREPLEESAMRDVEALFPKGDFLWQKREPRPDAANTRREP